MIAERVLCISISKPSDSTINLLSQTARLTPDLDIEVERNGTGYQSIRDTVTVRPGETVSRHYAAPISRRPYHYGWRWSISFARFGGAPNDNYAVTSRNGLTFGDLKDEVDGLEELDHDSMDLYLGAQFHYFANRHELFGIPLAAGLSFAWSDMTFEARYLNEQDESKTADASLNLSHASVGLGFWHELSLGARNDAVGWVTLNRAREQGRWSVDIMEEACRTFRCEREPRDNFRLPGGDAVNDYLFLELGIHVSSWSFALRASDKTGGFAPALVVSWGSLGMSRGTRYSESVTAQRGIHYE